MGNQRGHELADHITRIVALLADELSTSDAAKESSRSDVTHALSTARSLQALADEGMLDAKFEVPCLVVGSVDDAHEASLAENFQRLAMNPADECLAFGQLIEQGSGVEGVAT